MLLSGGTGGRAGERLYIPRQGISVRSSAPVYSNGPNHSMSSLFTGTPTSTLHTDYWLTHSTGAQSLVFDFESPIRVALIRVCATPFPNANYRSNYRIAVTSVTGNTYAVTEGFVNTTGDVLGHFHVHAVRKEGIIEIHFELTQEGSCGVSLKEIEIWVVA
jgi:hypothetical protein